MASLKRKTQNRKPHSRWERFKRWGSATLGILALSIFCNCSAPTKTRCYGYEDKNLKVYVENPNTSKGKELGKEHLLKFSQLGISDENGNSEPLAYFCTNSGHLFWVTKDSVYIRKISLEDGRFRVNEVIETSHVEPSEYVKKDGKEEIVSADIWHNPDEKWENITVITLTKNGLFQASRYSRIALADKKPERIIYDLMRFNKIKQEFRWPKKGVMTGVAHVLSGEEFVAIPVGKQWEGTVRYYYMITLKGNRSESFREREVEVETMQPCGDNEGLKNVFEIVRPLRLDKASGGIVIDLTGEKRNGEELQLLPIIKKIQKN